MSGGNQRSSTQTAVLTQAGAAQMDALVTDARAASRAAVTATTPAAQRAILNALRSQLARTLAVVSSTQTAAAELADGLQTWQYPGEGDTHQHRTVQLVDNKTTQQCTPYDYGKNGVLFVGGLAAGIAGVVTSEIGIGVLGMIAGATAMGVATTDTTQCLGITP
jgi:hypothetical protein